jgi:hypothetical protein
MNTIRILFISFLIISSSFAEENRPKITKYEVEETLDMLGGKENLMKGVKELAEKKFHLANQIIYWEKSPKITKRSDLDIKKMILDLEVINQRINKETYVKNMITFNEYNIEFIGTKDEINHFLTELFFDKQEVFSLDNILEYIEFENRKFDIEKDILFDYQAFVKYRIHMIKKDENNSIFKLFVNLH